ncbi:O-antigen translocase [Chitinophagaceae bacterium LB-8]|uniref:O-antigen translocase n=1 Tax=Paraflavisolibacter caeni TaxID=2982496 RepID=A0A9X3BGW2_9BACT|nr:O-antigen translocase [Paraflavisolibacter caeni]MCU7548497.1 O-antigen translocase [Paraflavisolibacter caeni]
MLKKIIDLCKRFWRADIVKVFSLTSISTLVKMLTGLISVKVVSVIIGPGGIALLGQLNSFSTIIYNFASGGINSGVTKYVAENKQSDEKIKSYLSVAFKITLYCSLLAGIFMIIFHDFLSKTIMLSNEYGYLFILFGLAVFLYAVNGFLLSILNGFKELKKFVSINIINALVGVGFTICLVYFWGLRGALISAVTFQSFMVFITIWMMRRLPWLKLDYFRQRIDKTILKKYTHYALMTFVTAVTVPVSQLIIRAHIISTVSPIQAGWWEAMNRISGMYVMVITSSFGVYYLPRLSELKNKLELRHEIFKAYKVILPILCVGFAHIYFFRIFIIKVLFAPDFYPMENLFVWQLLGDFFKIASWLLAFLMIAKSMTKTFIATEIIFSASLVCFSFFFIRMNGLVGITQAYCLNYLIYFLVMGLIFKKIIFH